MEVHQTVAKLKNKLVHYLEYLNEERDKRNEYLRMIESRDFESIKITVREKGIEKQKEFQLDNLKYFDKKKVNKILAKEISDVKEDLNHLEALYGEITSVFGMINSYTITKPVTDLTLFFYKLILVSYKIELDITLEDILDVILLTIYENNKYYKNHSKEYAEINDLANYYTTQEENIILRNFEAFDNLKEIIDKDGNIIPKIPEDEFIKYLEIIFPKEIFGENTVFSRLEVTEELEPNHKRIMDYYRTKYKIANEEYNKKRIIAAKLEEQKEYERQIKQKQYKENKKQFIEQINAIKELEIYYQNGEIVKIYPDLDEFLILLNKTGIEYREIRKIYNKMKNALQHSQKEAISIPNILKTDIQKEIYLKVKDSEDENIKYYLDEIYTADTMWKIADSKEKLELEEYVSEILDNICFALNLKKETLSLNLKMEEE